MQIKAYGLMKQKPRSETFKITLIRITLKRYKSTAKEFNALFCGMMDQVPFYLIFLSKYIFQVASVFFFFKQINRNIVGLSAFNLKMVSEPSYLN